MKQEALKRMKTLKLYSKIVEDFARENKIYQSERHGYLYWLDDNEEKMVKEFEEKYNCLVYHVIHQYTNFGELYSYLYVSNEEEEWKYDIEDLKAKLPLCYVYNLTHPQLSEFGIIEIELVNGGLERIF